MSNGSNDAEASTSPKSKSSPKTNQRMHFRLTIGKLNLTMVDIEVGIPVLTEVNLAMEKARQLRERGFTGPIHISVNKGSNLNAVSIPEGLRPLKVSVHELDRGLYENFRFLMNEAQSKFFAWVAVDDLPDVRYWEKFADENYDLLLGELLFRWESSSGFDEKVSFMPNSDAFVNVPANIFGLWRLEFLRDIYPSGKAFDWLDTYLLLAAHRVGTVNWRSGAKSTIHVRQGQPHRVNGRFHLPFGYTVHAIKLFWATGLKVGDFMFLIRGMVNKSIFSFREIKAFYFSR